MLLFNCFILKMESAKQYPQSAIQSPVHKMINEKDCEALAATGNQEEYLVSQQINYKPRIFAIDFYPGESSFKGKSTNGIFSVEHEISSTPKVKEEAPDGNESNQIGEESPSKKRNYRQKQGDSQENQIKFEDGVARGAKKMFEFNRVIQNIVENKPSVKKMTRGIWSIASRKYQPNQDISQIFNQKEIAANSFGLDQCKLWRNLMNKYINKKKSGSSCGRTYGRRKGRVIVQDVKVANEDKSDLQVNQDNEIVNESQHVLQEVKEQVKVEANQIEEVEEVNSKGDKVHKKRIRKSKKRETEVKEQ